MPFYVLVKADLENVESFAPEEHSRWTLDLKESGGSEERLGVVVSDEEEHDMAGKSHAVSRSMRSFGAET
jgi:hypothetical protein